MATVDVTDITEIPFEQVLGLFSTLPGFIWLDSSDTQSSQSNYSYLAANPVATIDPDAGPTELAKFLAHWANPPNAPSPEFSGMIAGFIGYEALKSWGLPELSKVKFHSHPRWPNHQLGVYPVVVRINHLTHNMQLVVNTDISENSPAEWHSRMRSAPAFIPQKTMLQLRPHTGAKEGFIHSVATIQKHIADGDIYQLNLTRQITALLTEGGPLDVYWAMRQNNPSPFGAYLDTGFHQILSMSPELLFNISNKMIETRPIKGTLKRTGFADVNEGRQLLESTKDTSELTMIVDLLRNDLGRVCLQGSVHVPQLKTVETYATLHHLVATIRGQLNPNISYIDILKAIFPGGSITGAPKYRAMELIGQIESIPRSVYTGAIGYFGLNGDSQFNIAIRTAIHDRGVIAYHTGCGIVADSNPEAEWEESMTKSHAFERLCR